MLHLRYCLSTVSSGDLTGAIPVRLAPSAADRSDRAVDRRPRIDRLRLRAPLATGSRRRADHRREHRLRLRPALSGTTADRRDGAVQRGPGVDGLRLRATLTTAGRWAADGVRAAEHHGWRRHRLGLGPGSTPADRGDRAVQRRPGIDGLRLGTALAASRRADRRRRHRRRRHRLRLRPGSTAADWRDGAVQRRPGVDRLRLRATLTTTVGWWAADSVRATEHHRRRRHRLGLGAGGTAADRRDGAMQRRPGVDRLRLRTTLATGSRWRADHRREHRLGLRPALSRVTADRRNGAVERRPSVDGLRLGATLTAVGRWAADGVRAAEHHRGRRHRLGLGTSSTAADRRNGAMQRRPGIDRLRLSTTLRTTRSTGRATADRRNGAADRRPGIDRLRLRTTLTASRGRRADHRREHRLRLRTTLRTSGTPADRGNGTVEGRPGVDRLRLSAAAGLARTRNHGHDRANARDRENGIRHGNIGGVMKKRTQRPASDHTGRLKRGSCLSIGARTDVGNGGVARGVRRRARRRVRLKGGGRRQRNRRRAGLLRRLRFGLRFGLGGGPWRGRGGLPGRRDSLFRLTSGRRDGLGRAGLGRVRLGRAALGLFVRRHGSLGQPAFLLREFSSE
jgi:hypothetical protein